MFKNIAMRTPLKGFRPAHPDPPKRAGLTGQIVRYLNRTYRVLPTVDQHSLSEGNRVWYDDQRDVHRQIFDGDQMVDYAFMGDNPDAPDNRWLREAFENQVPIIYFLGIAPGRYQAILPAFIGGWDRSSKRAHITFGFPGQSSLHPA